MHRLLKYAAAATTASLRTPPLPLPAPWGNYDDVPRRNLQICN